MRKSFAILFAGLLLLAFAGTSLAADYGPSLPTICRISRLL